MKVLLASSSPRRRELLKLVFDEFDVFSPRAEEDYIGKDNYDTVNTIAKRKLAASIKSGYDIIIAADTMVFIDNKQIGKPRDKEEAFEVLSLLNGRVHDVISSLAIWIRGKTYIVSQASKVTFNRLSEDEILDYINTHEVMDKAGAYAIQDGVVVAGFEGDYTNIVGLPVELLRKTLEKSGVKCK